MGGRDPYSSSKGCAELVVSAYRRSYFSQGPRTHRTLLASVRAGNVIGGGDWSEDRLIPDCIRALLRREPISIRNPQAARPWQHVLEPLGAYVLLAEKLHAGGEKWTGSWNFGPREEDAVPVATVADLVVKNWGDGTWKTAEETGAAHEAHYLKLDCGKAKGHLGWTPALRIDEAVGWTCEWYRLYKDRGSLAMKEFSVKQIDKYVELAERKRDS